MDGLRDRSRERLCITVIAARVPGMNDTGVRAAIFDMDGVLIDSYRAHLKSWQAVGASEGIGITERAFAETFGRTSREVVADLWRDPAMPESRVAAIDHAKEAAFREIISEDFPEMAGARKLLSDLRNDGWKLAVASSGPPANVDLAVKHFTQVVQTQTDRLFDVVITGADVTHGKPHPEVFELAASRLEVDPGGCVVLEDAIPGVRAANRAGIACVVVRSTGHTDDEYDGLRVRAIEADLTGYSAPRLALAIAEESADLTR